MRFEPLPLAGAWTIDLERHVDQRGWFARTFCEDEFAAHGLPVRFPQSNLSTNRHEGTIRGMHVNVAGKWEAKLVRCVRGAIHDVIVDLRPNSPTRHRWYGLELSSDNARALFVPEGFAHGFMTLVDHCDVYYQMGSAYVADAGRGFRWDDPTFAIDWPTHPVIISERDATYPDFEPSEFGLEVP